MAPAAKMVQSILADAVARWNADGTLDAIQSVLAAQWAFVAKLDLNGTLSRLNHELLPPNLKSVADQVSASDVWKFLAHEGIPLYRVPRASIAMRFLHAPTHSARRRLLTTCSHQIIEDCGKVLDGCVSGEMRRFVEFTQDGLCAMNAGAHLSAQAAFTVTLDTLITALVPDHDQRRVLTKKTHGTAVPDAIDEMQFHSALVWLAVWNGHLEYWVKNGDEIPSDYSRHASIHAVSRRQYSKRNCVQSLMLLTSLISWAEEHLIKNTHQQQQSDAQP